MKPREEQLRWLTEVMAEGSPFHTTVALADACRAEHEVLVDRLGALQVEPSIVEAGRKHGHRAFAVDWLLLTRTDASNRTGRAIGTGPTTSVPLEPTGAAPHAATTNPIKIPFGRR